MASEADPKRAPWDDKTSSDLGRPSSGEDVRSVPLEVIGPYRLVRVLGDLKFVTFLVIFSGFWVVFWQQYISLPLYVRTYINPDINIDRILAWEAGTVIATTFIVNYLTRKIPPSIAIIAGVLISSVSWLFLTLGSSIPLIIVALIPLQMAAFAVWPTPTTAIDAFALFRRSAVGGLVAFDLLLIASWSLSLTLFFALYVALRDRAPLRRTVETSEVADAALFLLGPTGKAITGEVLMVDGGYHAMGI